MVATPDALPLDQVPPTGPVEKAGQERRAGPTGRRPAKAYLACAPFLLLYLILIVIPSLGLLIKSFSTNESADLELLDPPSLFRTTYTLANYRALFSEADNIQTIVTTVVISVIAVALAVVIGTPIAYQMAVDRNRLSRLANWILSLPIYLPTVVVAYALVLLFGPNGILNAATSTFGFGLWDISYTATAVVLGTVYVLLPMYLRLVSAAIAKVPLDLISASMSLGAGELRTLVRVVLPVVRPTIIAAVILDFAFAVGLVEIALIVGGGPLNVPYLPVAVLQRSTTYQPDIPLTAAMAAVLVAIALLGQMVASRFAPKAGGRATH